MDADCAQWGGSGCIPTSVLNVVGGRGSVAQFQEGEVRLTIGYKKCSTAHTLVGRSIVPVAIGRFEKLKRYTQFWGLPKQWLAVKK